MCKDRRTKTESTVFENVRNHQKMLGHIKMMKGKEHFRELIGWTDFTLDGNNLNIE